MRIACLAHYYIEDNRAGGELMLHGLLSALAKVGHDVTALITDTGRPNTVIDGVKVMYAVRPDIGLSTVDYDVAVSHFQNGPHALKHARVKHKPLIYVVHNDMPQTINMLTKLQPTDLAVFNTHWIQRKCNPRSSKVVVHPPIDRKAMKTKQKGEYVTLVNLTQPKGVDIFFRLADLMPEVQFLGVKGGYWKERQSKVTRPNVTIIENTPNMRDDVYAKSKVVLMPSTYETFGMVAAEAIVSGIPVVCTPTAGLKENLGDAGIYLPRGYGDIYAWKQQIEKLLYDNEYYEDVSEKCLEQSKKINTATELKEFVKAVESL